MSNDKLKSGNSLYIATCLLESGICSGIIGKPKLGQQAYHEKNL